MKKANKKGLIIGVGMALVVVKGVIIPGYDPSLYAPMASARSVPPKMAIKSPKDLKKEIKAKDDEMRQLDAQIARAKNPSEKKQLQDKRTMLQMERDQLQDLLNQTKTVKP